MSTLHQMATRELQEAAHRLKIAYQNLGKGRREAQIRREKAVAEAETMAQLESVLAEHQAAMADAYQNLTGADLTADAPETEEPDAIEAIHRTVERSRAREAQR